MRTKIEPSHTDYPNKVCFDCARNAGARAPDVCTMWAETCGICRQWKTVTSPRHFGWPVFELTARK